MTEKQDTTLLVLASEPANMRVASALQSAAKALGYEDGCYIAQIGETADLRMFIFESDPWSVMAVDDESISALQNAFGLEFGQFAPDRTAHVCGYQFVAVPGFAECLDDHSAKRVAWHRMKAAAHPGNPIA